MKHSFLAAAILCAAALCNAPHAKAQTVVGLHLATLHLPARDYNGVNPGLYIKTENGFTAGVFENSVRRLGVYAGLTIEQDDGPFALTGGLIYGYQRRVAHCVAVSVMGDPHAQVCGTTDGSPGALAPMLNPSVRFGFARLTVIPPWFGAKSVGLHVSVERGF